MPWIESHQTIERHYKTLDLMTSMGWDIDTTIGKLHRFWWWCMDYVEDGDLRKHSRERLGAVVGLSGESAEKFIESMVSSRYLDDDPYFRIHDWWDYYGRFLQVKYKNKQEKWKKIKELYHNVSKGGAKGGDENHKPTNQPNQPNILPLGEFLKGFWEPYPKRNGKRIGKEAAYKKYLEVKKEDRELLHQAVKNYANSKMVKKGIGIKDPKRFITNRDNPEYWREWIEPEEPQVEGKSSVQLDAAGREMKYL